ncbi:MAG: cyclic nucleotide-binding domain-containing protein [Candidatus Bipolaricaulaceae bacterium]
MRDFSGPPQSETCSAHSHCLIRPLRANLSSPGPFGFQVAKKQTIFVQGMPVMGWYFLCQGSAKIIYTTAAGKRLLIRFCGPGDLLNAGLSPCTLLRPSPWKGRWFSSSPKRGRPGVCGLHRI